MIVYYNCDKCLNSPDELNDLKDDCKNVRITLSFSEKKKVNLLFLSCYGDYMPNEIRERLFGKKYHRIAVNLDTGFICLVKMNENYIEVENSYYKIPRYWIRKLFSEKCQLMKRPYNITIDSYYMLLFMNREIGYSDLPENLVFLFKTANGYLEVNRSGYRHVNNWRDNV